MTQNETQTILQTPYFKPFFQISKYTNEQQKILTMFNFQHSQITQQETEELAELLLKYPMVYATSKFDAGEVITPLHLPLKLDANFKKTTSK